MRSPQLLESARLHRLFARWWAYTLNENPEFATYVGVKGHDHRWTDRSPEAIERRRRDPDRCARELAAIRRGALAEKDRLSYDLFKRANDEAREARRFRDDFMPVTQMGGVQQDVPAVLDLMPPGAEEDALRRLEAVPGLVDQTMALMRRGLAAGLTPPRITLRDLPAQVLNVIPKDPAKSPLLKPFAKPDRLRKEACRVYAAKLVPAFKRLHAFLTQDYLPRTREAVGVSALPDGRDWYAFLVRQHTTTDLSPKEIHAIGLSEVARIRKAMRKVMAEAGFRGGFEAFHRHLRTAPRFFFKRPEDLLAAYRDICKRADPELARLFGTLPRLPYGVLPVPPHAEKSQTTAYYIQGSPMTGRPGVFYANTYDLKSRPSWEMEALSLHEAVPGHHLQIALAQEQSGLPEFRKHAGTTAYVEGWGLYSEHLGTEMGFYKDPYSRFGRLAYEMWRSIRLVVDTGIHALGWSRERAIRYFEAHSSKASHDITVEVDRYIVWPGQALAYKIGELRIKALRAEAERRLGKRFDVRGFHDHLLGEGALPLDVLEKRMRRWMR